MALTQARKQEIIANYQAHETDTGSSELQVAILTEQINTLSLHLQANKKDYSSQRRIKKMIGRRKRLLAYIIKKDPTRYRQLIERLQIRG